MQRLRVFLLSLLCMCQLQVVTAGEVNITSVQELLSNIGSQRVLRLAPGTYNLEGVVRQNGSAVRRFGNHGLFLVDVHNLKLVGSGADKTKLISPYLEDEVLTVHNCKDIQIEGLSLGHKATPGGCMGDTVLISNSQRVRLVKDDIYGCGRFGLAVNNVKELLVRDSAVHDCTYGLLNVGSVEKGRFSNTRFEHQGKLSVLNMFSTSDTGGAELAFENCSFIIDSRRKAFSYEGLPVQEFVAKHTLLSRPFQEPATDIRGFSFSNCSFSQVQPEERALLTRAGVRFEGCTYF